MKLTKSQLKQIIEEELETLQEKGFGQGTPPKGEIYKKRSVYLEDSEKEMMANMERAEAARLAAKKGIHKEDPEAREIPKDAEGNLLWGDVDMPTDLHERVTNLWLHLNGLLKKWYRPESSEGIQYKKDLYFLMDDFLRSPDRPSPGAPE